MPLTLAVADEVLPTQTDATRSLQNEASLLFRLSSALLPLLNTPLSDIAPGAVEKSLSYAGPAVTFNPGAGPVTFGLQANAAVELGMHAQGELAVYHDGLEQPVERSIPIAAGRVYLSLSLALNLSGNASGTYSGGAYGVRAELDTTRTNTVSFFKAFSPSMLIRDAVAALFESFVFPLHVDTFNCDFALGYCLPMEAER